MMGLLVDISPIVSSSDSSRHVPTYAYKSSGCVYRSVWCTRSGLATSKARLQERVLIWLVYFNFRGSDASMEIYCIPFNTYHQVH